MTMIIAKVSRFLLFLSKGMFPFSRQIPDPLNNATRFNINLHVFPFSPPASRGQRGALTIHVEVSLPCQFHLVLIQLKCNSIALSIKVAPSVVRFQVREIRD
jgi:hypothetical protein